jgi:hypothetical protein
MIISAANLIKQSMKQMVYFHFNKSKPQPSQRMIDGTAYQDKFNFDHKERRGIYTVNDINIFFSIDGIHGDIAYEIKHIDHNLQWLVNMSIIQTSFYHSLLHKVSSLDTPKFMTDKEHPYYIMDLNSNKINYYLLVTKDSKYAVEPSKQVFYHYVYKALLLNKIINGDYDHYDEAAKWDNLFKHKEHYLLKHINYKPI